MAQWVRRGHRVPLSGPWGPSREIPAAALPSPPPTLAQPGRRKREPRANTSSSSASSSAAPPCLLLRPLPLDPLFPLRGGEEAGVSGGAPPGRLRLEARSQPSRWTPRTARPSPGCPRAPASPGSAPRSERAAAQVGAFSGFAHPTRRLPLAASGLPQLTARPCAPRPAGTLHSGVPVVLAAQGALRGGSSLPPILTPLLGRKRNLLLLKDPGAWTALSYSISTLGS